MRIPRFFVRNRDLDSLKRLAASGQLLPGSPIELAEHDLMKQLRSVLRLGKGDKLLILDGEGRSYELTIEQVEKSGVHCLVSEIIEAPPDSRSVVSFGLALIKPDRFEWCLEKLTELGVDEIVPVQTSHCVSRLSAEAKGEDRLQSKLARWQSIVREAAEQCERTTIPPVVMPETLSSFLGRPAGGVTTALRYICTERQQVAPLVKALNDKISNRDPKHTDNIRSVSILVGPEGGFTEGEIAEAIEKDWTPVSLGRRILRSETASIVAMSQVASLLDI